MIEGRSALDRGRHAGDDRFARRHPEGSALEGEILHRDRNVLALELAVRERDRVGGAGLGAVLLHAVGVALDVAELQRVRLGLRAPPLLIVAVVEERREPGLGADRHVVAGARHDHEVGFEVLVEDELPALRAFTHRFSGVSRLSSDRIFGGTTFRSSS